MFRARREQFKKQQESNSTREVVEEITEELPDEPIKTKTTTTKGSLFNKQNEPEVEEKIVEEIQDEIKETEPKDDSLAFIWANTEEYEAKMEKLNNKKKKKRKGKRDKKDVDETPKIAEEKVELSKFFENSKKNNSKLKFEEEPKEEKKTKKSKKQTKREKNFQDLKDQKAFRFRGKRYTKIEDFVAYLHDHYIDIEEISREVLDDENFFGWVSKKSGIFDVSLKEFKEIKAKIEDKS